MTEVLFIVLGLGLSFLLVYITRINEQMQATIKAQQTVIDYLKEDALPASIRREAHQFRRAASPIERCD